MNITFENAEKVSGVLTLVVEEADYAADVEKALKDYRKKANIPGFRPGMAPMGMIKRQIGASLKVDTINKLVGNKIYEYVKENKINMLGEPMQHLGAQPVDLDAPAPYTLQFDIAVAPEFEAKLSGHDKVPYYEVNIDDKAVDQQIAMYTSQNGSHVKVSEYQDNDMLKGDMRELNEDGSTKEDGITVADVVMLPAYMKNDEQKQLFEGCKTGDIIIFNPRKAYPEGDVEISSMLKISKEEAANLTADFSYKITEISRYQQHAVDQELFDRMYGPGVVTSEAEYAVKLAKGEELVNTETFFDGTYDIPYVKLDPIAVNIDNMNETVISGGFHLKEDVYINVTE